VGRETDLGSDSKGIASNLGSWPVPVMAARLSRNVKDLYVLVLSMWRSIMKLISARSSAAGAFRNRNREVATLTPRSKSRGELVRARSRLRVNEFLPRPHSRIVGSGAPSLGDRRIGDWVLQQQGVDRASVAPASARAPGFILSPRMASMPAWSRSLPWRPIACSVWLELLDLRQRFTPLRVQLQDLVDWSLLAFLRAPSLTSPGARG